MKILFKNILKESGIKFPFKNTKNIYIINNVGEKVIVKCEIAQTPEEKSQGLLYRDNLCDNCGVLFDSNGSYHMIGMQFPIEMIFIDNGYIVDIVKSIPGDDNINPNQHYTHNLEVNDSFCVKNGITVGCEVVG